MFCLQNLQPSLLATAGNIRGSSTGSLSVLGLRPSSTLAQLCALCTFGVSHSSTGSCPQSCFSFRPLGADLKGIIAFVL